MPRPSNQRRATLSDLPVELIVQICGEFCIHCTEGRSDSCPPAAHASTDPDLLKELKERRKALYNLSLVCKKIKTEAQTILYHMYGYIDDIDRTLHKFCRTISRNRGLAAAVKSVCLKYLHGNHWLGWMPWSRPVITQLSSQLVDATISIDDPAQRIGFLRRMLPAVTLLQLPKLKQLIIHGRDSGYLLDGIRRRPGNELLPELRWLTVAIPIRGDTVSMMRPSQPLPVSEHHLGGFLMDFAGLRSLSLWHVMNSTIPQNLRLPHVRNLSLKNTCLSREGLRRFVHATGDLTSFMYSEIQGEHFIGLISIDLGNDPPATSHDIFSVLESKKNSLEKAAVFTYHRGPTEQMIEPSPTLEPLSQLHKLKDLELNVRTFFDPVPFARTKTRPDNGVLLNHTPPSLRRLSISGGAAGVKCILPSIKQFCKVTGNGQLTQAAESLRAIVINVTMGEERYERHHGVIDEDADNWLQPDLMEEKFHRKRPEWAQNGGRKFEVVTELEEPHVNYV